jgi:hypothetical protein
MGIRDKEITRIENYARGLGTKIEWKRYISGGTDAEWFADGEKIAIYQWPRKSKTMTILTLVHELAHHLAWVNAGRKEDPKVTEALEADANHVKGQPPIAKEYRKIIYELERDDAMLRDKIFTDLNLKVPLYKFKADKKVDVWYYRQFYLTGKRPTNKAYKEMCRRFERHQREFDVCTKNQA